MNVIIGCIVVIGAVLAGFTWAGGHVGALIHPSEVVTIGGAALGALIMMSSKKVLKDLIHGILAAIKGAPYNRQMYTEMFKLCYDLLRTARRDGLLALEPHVNNPHASEIVQKYPKIAANHHAIEFLSVLSKTADALPGFGIVAAVLGIVITMGAIDGPVEEIGHKVGAALVGTFLGILASYGFFAPLAARMEFLGAAELAFFRTISAIVLAFVNDCSPKVALEQARRGVGTDVRPSRAEMEELFREVDAS
jgi:chemotaxis protein MotA